MKPSRWNDKAVLAFGALLCVFFTETKAHAMFGTTSEPLNFGQVRRTDLLQQVTVAGLVIPNRRTLISPPYNGYVQKVFVKIGSQVKAGDPILSLSQSARSDHEDIHPMRAPFTGTVVQVLHQDGEYVETGKENNALVRIDDLSHLFINTDVAEADIVKIRVGQEVVIKATAILNRSYKGMIREISLAAKEKKEWSRSGDRVEFAVRVEVTDKDDQLKPGMSAIIDIITDKRQAVLALPHEYVQKVGEDFFVTLTDGERKKVEVGLQNEELFEIRTGLKENDRVRMVDFFSKPPGGKS